MHDPLEPYRDYPIEPGPVSVQGVKVMFGANYFSAHAIVAMRVNLGAYDEVFTNLIPGFFEELKRRLPTLEQHKCSEGVEGGFFTRVVDGTLLGHVIEHTAIELQSLAGMKVSYGKTRGTNTPGVYNVIFHFRDDVAGIYAGKAAVNLVNGILLNRPFDVERALADLVDIREHKLLGPSTQALVEAARNRGIPTLRLDEYNLVQLGTGRHARRVRATITAGTGFIAVDTADNKYLAGRMLRDAGIPVPETVRVRTPADIAGFFQRSGGAPLVVKPLQGSAGEGLTLGVQEPGGFEAAFARAAAVDRHVLVQPLVEGDLFRLLVVNDRFVAATRLRPPAVTGDGARTVAELVEALNREPERGVGDKTPLSRMDLDAHTRDLLEREGLSPDAVPAPGRRVVLKVSPKPRTGGDTEDVTDRVHPVNRFLAERAAKVIGLDVAGVDIVAPDIARPILDGGGVVLEVNAAPDFRMHLNPSAGLPRDVAAPVVDMMFPPGSPVRIPVFSVTGTLGKTTTAFLIAHCLRLHRLQVGMTSTEGIFIAEKCLIREDAAYPEHVALVLRDPTIDVAVLETSREGILRRGLGYERADFGIVLNVADDHLGSDDINYLEDLAYAKSVVAEQVHPEGFAVLNADDELVMEMTRRVDSGLILYSRGETNPDVRRHVEQGGTAAILRGTDLVILKGREEVRIMDLVDAPLTFEGKAMLNAGNLLAAAAALHAFGLPPDKIRQGFRSFFPDAAKLPGRLNLVSIRDFRVLLDYAHNKKSLLALKDFLATFAERKVGVLDAPGDRSDEDIVQMGRIAAGMFDRVVLYEGIDDRGRKPGEVTGLLGEGLRRAGFPETAVTVAPDPEAAWTEGLRQGDPGTLVVLLSGRSGRTLSLMERFAADAPPTPAR